MGVRFRVSPDAFFQVNSKAAEALYSTINELTTTVSGKEPVVYGKVWYSDATLCEHFFCE